MAKEKVPSYYKYEKIRKAAELTDYRVSVEAKVPRSSLSEWRTGKRPLPMKHIESIAKYLKVSVDDLTKKA